MDARFRGADLIVELETNHSFPGTVTLEEICTNVKRDSRVVIIGDRLILVGDEIWTGSLAAREVHRAGKSEVGDIQFCGRSCHYGLLLVTWYGRSQPMFYVEFKDEKTAKLPMKD